MPAGDANARAFQAQIAPKWIAADGKSFWLVWSDFQIPDPDGLRRSIGEPPDADPTVAKVMLFRKYMPYFSFNTQRVDLLI